MGAPPLPSHALIRAPGKARCGRCETIPWPARAAGRARPESCERPSVCGRQSASQALTGAVWACATTATVVMLAVAGCGGGQSLTRSAATPQASSGTAVPNTAANAGAGTERDAIDEFRNAYLRQDGAEVCRLALYVDSGCPARMRATFAITGPIGLSTLVRTKVKGGAQYAGQATYRRSGRVRTRRFVLGTSRRRGRWFIGSVAN